MLRLTPGALTSNLLEQRPAALPADLFVHGGVAPTHIDLIIFGSEGPRRQAFTSRDLLEAIHQLRVPVWVRIRGLADARGIQSLLDDLGVPPSLAEPLLQPPQRPQVDCLDEVLMVVIHRLRFGAKATSLVSDQVGLMLMPGLLISVEESCQGEAFPDLTRWLISSNAAVEDRDLDDILHFLIDDLLDDLFPMLERISLSLDQLEEKVLGRPNPGQLARTFKFRGCLRTIRTQVWPLRHQIRMLVRERQPLLGPEATAASRSRSHRAASKSGQRSRLKERSRPGARPRARQAASISRVPEPQKGSARGTVPSQPVWAIRPAARFSLSGARPMAAR